MRVVGVVVVVLVFFCVASFPVSGQEEGLRFEQVLAGGSAAQVLRVQGGSQDAPGIAFGFEGEIASWLVVNISSVSSSVDGAVDLVVSVSPPQGVAAGRYRGLMTLRYLRYPEGSTTTAVLAERFVPIEVGVTDVPMRRAVVGSVETTSTEAGLPLPVLVVASNEGNVPEPVVVFIRLLSDGRAVYERVETFEVAPFASERFLVLLPSDGVGSGEYALWVSAKVTDDEYVFQKPLRIYESGAFGQKVELIIDDIGVVSVNESVKLRLRLHPLSEAAFPVAVRLEVLRQGVVVKETQSVSRLLEPGGDQVVVFDFVAPLSGVYTLRATAFDGSSLFATALSSIDVRDVSTVPLSLGLLLLVVVGGLLGVVLLRRRVRGRRWSGRGVEGSGKVRVVRVR